MGPGDNTNATAETTTQKVMELQQLLDTVRRLLDQNLADPIAWGDCLPH